MNSYITSQEAIGNSKNPDLIYYNLDIIDGKTEDEGFVNAPVATFNETRDTAIIDDTSKQQFSIVRFTMNGPDKLFPMFIPTIEVGQPDPNKTIYQITLRATVNQAGNGQSFTVTKNIEFVSQNTTAPTPLPPTTRQDLGSNYYQVMNQEHWVQLVNNTQVEIWDDINTQFRAFLASVGQPVVDLTTPPPQMYYNRDTQKFELQCGQYGFGGASRSSAGGVADEDWQMFFDSNCYGLFSFFPNNYLGGDLASLNSEGVNNLCQEILIKNELGKNTYTYNSIDFWVVKQDFISTSTLWSPIASIVFVSTLIPVQNEQTGQPIRFGQGNVQSSIGSRSAFQPIVTDIALQNITANDQKEFLSQVPTAEYRLASLTNSPQEVRNIDIQVYWKNRLDGQLVPVKLQNQSTIQVKILFRRRDFNSKY